MPVENEGTAPAPAATPEATAAAAAAAAVTGNQGQPAAVTPSADKPVDANAPAATDQFAELDTDTREWLTKREVKDLKGAAKLAHEQSKLLGNAIRVPGENATQEERDAFLDKLGRPKTAEEYDFKPPSTLPENLPYDGERAKSFASLAHTQGLTKAQAAAIHNWAVENAVTDFNGQATATQAQLAEAAKGETQKLEKLWGPLDGATMKANLTYADKALREVGGAEALAEFQRVGLIGTEGKAILSAPIAQMLAKFGQAVFKEDTVLRGNPDRLNNPFVDGKDFNVTAQMRLYKEDPDTAKAFIAAAGKQPSDFGLKA